MEPEMFGPYRLESRLGRGACGEVFRAYDTVLKRPVAVKRILPGIVSDPEFRIRFQRESELVGRLASPHVIPIHNHGEINERLYIDMRLAHGPDLATVLAREGALPVPRAVRIVSQTASALQAAHTARLIHRDVKPSNILVTDADGEDFCYLADFGIAKSLDGSAALSLTGTNAVVGTLAYMAPELFETGRGSYLVDVYALGCVLFECLTGQRPFPVEGLAAHAHHHMSVPPPRPSSLAAVPSMLDDVVVRAMSKRPQDRFERVADLAYAARRAVEPPVRTASAHPATIIETNPTGGTRRDGTAAEPAPLLRDQSPTPTHRLRLFLVAVALLVVVLVVTGFSVSSQYFVTAEAGQVVIDQGYPGTFAGISLYRVVEATGIRFADLDPYERARIDGNSIPADDLSNARSVVAGIQNSTHLPMCSELDPSLNSLEPGFNCRPS